MKFTCDRKDLLKTIANAEPITGSKSNFTILANILIETHVEDSALFIKSTNQESSMIAKIPGKIVDPGSITIIQSKLLDIIRQLPGDEIAIEVDENNLVSVKSMDKKRNANAKIIGLPSKDFPKIEAFSEEQESITIDKLTLARMIKKVIFAVSNDNSKYTLNGVFFECQEKSLKMVAIDGRRMAMIENECPEHKHKTFSAIIPHPFLSQLQKILITEGPVTFYFFDNKLHFKLDNMEFSTSVLGGNFPDYNMFVPQTHEFILNANTSDLTEAVNLASVLIDSESNKLVWKINNNTLNISAQNSNYGESKEDIFISYEGAEHNIGINYKLLIEILREIETTDIEFKFNNSVSPILVKEKNRNEYFFILMPMKLDN